MENFAEVTTRSYRGRAFFPATPSPPDTIRGSAEASREEAAEVRARAANADLAVMEVSCRTRSGLDAWYEWLRAATRAKKEAAHD